MAISWTRDQNAAVYAPVSNILVTAAAGSGKTQVLTGRIIQRIASGEVNVTRLLIMTFTRAAAAQMRERIGAALAAELEENPKNEVLRKQLSLLGAAKITTIDSFCMDVVRTNYFAAGLKPDFKIAGEDELALLTEEAALDTIYDLYEEENEDFLNLTRAYSNKRGDDEIIKLALEMLKFTDSMPYPEKWIQNACEEYRVSDAQEYAKLPVSVYSLECAKSMIFSAHSSLMDALDMIKEDKDYEKYAAFLSEMDAPLSKMIGDAQGDDKALIWDSLYKALDSFSAPRKPTIKNVNADTLKMLSSMVDSAKTNIKKAKEILCAPIGECALMHRGAYKTVKTIAYVANRINKKLDEKKAARSCLSFSDVMHTAIRILGGDNGTPTPAADTMANFYDEIYVDEYQDTNEMQELIFSLISRERYGKPNIFMVGDIKQSIYGFRQTSPELFMNKSSEYSEDENTAYRKIHLSKNFRSRKSIIDFTNGIFSRIMSEGAGGVNYGDGEELIYGAPFNTPSEQFKKIDFEIQETGDIEIPDGEDSPKATELEARLVAKKIKSLINGGATVYNAKSGETRPLAYSDIVILMRSAKTAAPIFARELEGAGIPVYSSIGGGFYRSFEISTFLSLLSVIDNPMSDIPLIATMRSPIFSFNEDELARIRLTQKEGCFYDALVNAAAKSDKLGIKCKSFINRTDKWRKISKHTPLGEFIWFLFEDTGYLSHVSALPSGDVRAANLQMLFDKANAFEKTSFKGLFSFLKYTEKLMEGDGQKEARLTAETQNVVRIMTVHASKGLEFPVVFLSSTASRLQHASKSKIIFHKKLGIGLKYTDADLRISYDLQSRLAVEQKNRDDEMSEELRILYVALTRATEKLIITAAGKYEKIEQAAHLLSAHPTPRNVLSAPNLITLLMSYPVWRRADRQEDGLISLNLSADYTSAAVVADKTPKKQEFDSCSESVKAVLEYEYPFKSFATIPAKVSVTELKRMMSEDGDTYNLYRTHSVHPPVLSMGKRSISPAERGRIIHLVMELIDFKNIETREDIADFLDELVQKNILTDEEAEAVPQDKIYAFLHSELGVRLKNADKIMREVPFTMPIPASLLTGREEHYGETVILQGIIDCLFFEGDEIVLVDYKSDKVKSEADIIAKYSLQIDFYRQAIEKKFFKKISKKYIYLFDNNGIIEIG